jgi:hypothetical protein
VEAVENAHYAEEHLNLNGGIRSTFPHHPGFMGKAPRTFSRGGSSRPPPYGNRVAPRIVCHRYFNGSECNIPLITNDTRQVHDHLREQLVGAGVLGEGTCDIPKNKVFLKFKICWKIILFLVNSNLEIFFPFMAILNFEFDNCNKLL